MSRASVILTIAISLFECANAFVTISSSSVSKKIHHPFITPHTHSKYATKMSLFSFDNDDDDEDDNMPQNGRRSFLFQSLLTPILTSSSANAYDDEEAGTDLTSKLYNPDGSLRSGATADEIEAKSKLISNIFPGISTTDAIVSYDGSSPISSSTKEEVGSHSSVKISYNIPEKWITQNEVKYVDTSEGINAQACNRIMIYQALGTSTEKALSKATTNGVAKTLGMTTSIGYSPTVAKADLIAGKKSLKNDGEDQYYEFDLAVAPATCSSNTADNLGLGFCPYDSILLASATVKDGRMFVCTVECSKDQWKRSSSDLKRIRSSFTVE